MKTFYTERDIEDMHAAGVTEIEIDDDVVLTEVAREKAIVLGLLLKRVESKTEGPWISGVQPKAAACQVQSPPDVGVHLTETPSCPQPAPPPRAVRRPH